MSTATAARRALLGAWALLGPLLLELAGCGGAPPRPRPAALEREAGLAHKGVKAWTRGDAAQALLYQEQALATARSVEDADGIALHLLEIAAIRRETGDPDGARAALGELLAAAPPLPCPPQRRVEALTLASLLALEGGDRPEARRRAAEALALCRAARCATEGRVLNLTARIDIQAGDWAAAGRGAEEALGLLRDAGDSEELANAHRLAASAALGSGRPADAAARYEQALAIDTRLAVSDKIRADLLGLAAAERSRGRTESAAAYLHRARAVARAAGDEAGATEAEALLESLSR
jgi:tetratricopeptide (TPR) repeat protein